MIDFFRLNKILFFVTKKASILHSEAERRSGMSFRIREMMMLEKNRTKVKAQPIPTAFSKDPLVAREGQTPGAGQTAGFL